MSPVRRAALRLESAEGRVQSITQGGGTDPSELEDAVFDRESQRNAFHLALREATGMEPGELARMLAL